MLSLSLHNLRLYIFLIDVDAHVNHNHTDMAYSAQTNKKHICKTVIQICSYFFSKYEYFCLFRPSMCPSLRARTCWKRWSSVTNQERQEGKRFHSQNVERSVKMFALMQQIIFVCQKKKEKRRIAK